MAAGQVSAVTKSMGVFLRLEQVFHLFYLLRKILLTAGTRSAVLYFRVFPENVNVEKQIKKPSQRAGETALPLKPVPGSANGLGVVGLFGAHGCRPSAARAGIGCAVL